MQNFILRLNIIQKLPYFKKPDKKEYLKPNIEAISFFLQVIIVAIIFVALENGYKTLFEKSLEENLLLLFNGIYFVFTSITTVGYGDISPTTLFSKAFVIVAVFFHLSMKLLKMFSSFVDAKSIINEFIRIGRLFKMKKDTIIVYCDAETIKRDNFLWLKRFVDENMKSTRFKDNEIVIVNHNEDAATMLNEAMFAKGNFDNRVTHLNINIDEENFFDKISIEHAAQVYILGDEHDTHSDSKVFDFAYRIKMETKYANKVTAEIANDANRKRMNGVGVNVIMRPNRAYPEMLVTATISEGTGAVLEELISRGDDTLEVFSIPENIGDFKWVDLLINLSVDGVGTAVGVVYDEHVDVNPMGNDIIKDGLKIVIMIYEMNNKSYSEQQLLIDKVFKKISLLNK